MSTVRVFIGSRPVKISAEELRKFVWRVHARRIELLFTDVVAAMPTYSRDPIADSWQHYLGCGETFGGYEVRTIPNPYELVGVSVRGKSLAGFRKVGMRHPIELEDARRERRVIRLFRSWRTAEAMERKAKRGLATSTAKTDLGLQLLVGLSSRRPMTLNALSSVLQEDVSTVESTLARLEESGLVHLQRNRYSCTKRGYGTLKQMEAVFGVDIGSLVNPEWKSFSDVVLSAASIKEGEVMENGQATALAREPEEVSLAAAENDIELMSNPNYRAYLEELKDLEASGEEWYVAYANGERIAKEKTFKQLLAKIGDRDEDVLIQEIPAKEINFYQPFQVEE